MHDGYNSETMHEETKSNMYTRNSVTDQALM